MKTAELKQALAGTTLDSRFCEIYGSAALETQKARYLRAEASFPATTPTITTVA